MSEIFPSEFLTVFPQNSDYSPQNSEGKLESFSCAFSSINDSPSLSEGVATEPQPVGCKKPISRGPGGSLTSVGCPPAAGESLRPEKRGGRHDGDGGGAAEDEGAFHEERELAQLRLGRHLAWLPLTRSVF